MTHPPDDRSLLAEAMAWSSRVTTIALEMALPGLLGHWIDRKLGTGVVFVALGAILGMTVGMLHLMRLARSRQDSGAVPPSERKS